MRRCARCAYWMERNRDLRERLGQALDQVERLTKEVEDLTRRVEETENHPERYLEALDPILFGRRARHLRQVKGFSLRAVQERIDISPSYLSLIEKGKRPPPGLRHIAKLAVCYGVTLETLLKGTRKGDAARRGKETVDAT